MSLSVPGFSKAARPATAPGGLGASPTPGMGAGRREEVLQVLDSTEADMRRGSSDCGVLALIHTDTLGEKDQDFQALDASLAVKQPHLMWLDHGR